MCAYIYIYKCVCGRMCVCVKYAYKCEEFPQAMLHPIVHSFMSMNFQALCKTPIFTVFIEDIKFSLSTYK